MTVTEELPLEPAMAQAHAPEERFRALTAERDAAIGQRDKARQDAAQLFAVSVRLENRYREQLADRDETIRDLRHANELRAVAIEEKDAELARHRAAATAYAALEQKPARPGRRPFSRREELALTVAALAAIAAGCMFPLHNLAAFLGAFVTAGVSGAYVLLARSAADRDRPFDLEPQEATDE